MIYFWITLGLLILTVIYLFITLIISLKPTIQIVEKVENLTKQAQQMRDEVETIKRNFH